MKLSKFINILTDALSENGDMDIVGMVDGTEMTYIEVNCPDKDSPMYIELYKE